MTLLAWIVSLYPEKTLNLIQVGITLDLLLGATDQLQALMRQDLPILTIFMMIILATSLALNYYQKNVINELSRK